MNKESKTASELEAVILQRAGERAGCADVKGVAVTTGDVGWRVVTILGTDMYCRRSKRLTKSRVSFALSTTSLHSPFRE